MKNVAITTICVLICLSITNAYKTITDVLSEDSKFSTLIAHLQHTRLIPYINSLEKGTFFAPDNQAFTKYNGRKITKELLLYHLLPNNHITEDLINGQVLETDYVRPGFLGSDELGQMVKITEKLNSLYHVNDARIKEKDMFVNANTTMNVIDRVLEPPRILSEVVEKRDEKLFDLMQKASVAKLIALERPFTTFISSKYILDKFNHIEKNYLVSEYGQDDLKKILKYLVISEPIYLDKLPTGKTNYTTESGETIEIKVLGRNAITVNGYKVVEKDILAANGVVHVLDDLPYTDSVIFDTRKYLFGLNATNFVALIDEYGLGQFLEKETSNLTILAPTNEVIDGDDIPNNQKKKWLSYHLVQGAWKPTDLYDHILLDTKYNATLLNNAPQKLAVRVDSRNDLDKIGLLKSIKFGEHSKVVGNDMAVNGNEIYRVSEPLSLPLDIFTSLVVDLELSTFIATLYVSNVVHEIKSAKAITLFVPTNQAFKSLGLVTRYLVHHTGRNDLQTVLKFHVVTSPLYYNDLRGDVLEVTTFANESLIINGNNNEGNVWVGTKHNDDTYEKRGVIQASDILVTNGVVHKIDHLQIPDNVNITHQNLLVGINANLIQDVFKRTGLWEKLDELKDSFILAPTDKAFENIDLEALWNDTKKLERIAKLHIVPKAKGRKPWFLYPLLGEQEFDTLLSAQDKVILLEIGADNVIVKVKGQHIGEHAHVLDMGRTSTGERVGGVIEIDTVLFPVDRGVFGLPWMWSVAIVTFLWMACLGLLVLGGFIVVKKLKHKRSGYETFLEAEEDDLEEEERVEHNERDRLLASQQQRYNENSN